MSSPSHENEEASSTSGHVGNGPNRSGGESAASEDLRPPAKRHISNAVIEISDTESDDSDICAVTSYQASADEVKRIRGDDYSSTSSSSSDYSSDSESQCEDDSVIIKDSKISTKPVRAQLYPRANRMEDPKLNNKIKSQDLIDRLSSHWEDKKDLKTEEVTLTAQPFRVCLLHDLLSNSDIINNIVDDMNTLDWSRKKLDLYEFHQTADLASLTWQRSIRGIYELLKTEVMTWVSRVTGLQLTSVSASCSLYGPGDHLLVHDDLLTDRRVAFILYLAPWQPPKPPPTENGADNHVDCDLDEQDAGWSERMGGALELLARDHEGPTEVVHKIYPRNNMLAFFKVGTDSYHRVGEVLSMELPRLSINGWFHGPRSGSMPASPARAAPAAPPPAPRDLVERLAEEAALEDAGAPPEPDPAPQAPPPTKPHTEVVVLSLWVEGAYMAPRNRASVQAQMERRSEACLKEFLQPDRCRELLEDLKQPDVQWERCGPADRRQYARVCAAWAEAQPAGRAARALLKLFSSGVFVRMLADCTDLALVGYERLELQRWRATDYTLIPPREQYQHPRLEAVFYLGAPDRPMYGGVTAYLAPEEPDETDSAALVYLPPDHNTLNLVYCDAGATSFRKYLGRLAMQNDDCFYVLACTYRE